MLDAILLARAQCWKVKTRHEELFHTRLDRISPKDFKAAFGTATPCSETATTNTARIIGFRSEKVTCMISVVVVFDVAVDVAVDVSAAIVVGIPAFDI